MARPKTDVVVRFLEKVKEMSNGCAEWQAGFHRDGYGKFQDDGRTQQAHRVAYRLFVGDPGELSVLHTCDNRKCVAIDHLFLGTDQDNVKDMDAKRRRGTRSKLTLAQAKEVKRLLGQRYSQAEVAEKFGVDQTTVSRIRRGQTTHFKE